MDGWQPYCGAEFGKTLAFGLKLATVPEWDRVAEPMVAGDPVICDLPPYHSHHVKHRSSELGFEWW